MRWYTITDLPDTEPLRLPSVTSILDVTMAQFRRDTLVRAEMSNPRAYVLNREAAIARGVAVDRWFKDSLVNGQLLPVPYSVTKLCSRLAPIARGIIATGFPVFTDELVYSIAGGYAGTLDVVATLPQGFRALIEIKTSAYTIWPEAVAEAQLQGAAYFEAWGALYPDRPLDAIATFHVTPYLMHSHVLVTPPAIAAVLKGWHYRLHRFASCFSAMEL